MRGRGRLLLSLGVGLGVYVGLAIVLYGVHRYAVPTGSGWVPAWYTAGELLAKAIIAVVPGFVTGWICKDRGALPGAVVGAVGGFIDIVMVAALTGIPFRAFGTRIIVTAVFTSIANALTNAAGGSAGKTLRARANPSGTASAEPEPTRRRRRRRLYAN